MNYQRDAHGKNWIVRSRGERNGRGNSGSNAGEN
jgi:hypothetical protein